MRTSKMKKIPLQNSRDAKGANYANKALGLRSASWWLTVASGIFIAGGVGAVLANHFLWTKRQAKCLENLEEGEKGFGESDDDADTNGGGHEQFYYAFWAYKAYAKVLWAYGTLAGIFWTAAALFIAARIQLLREGRIISPAYLGDDVKRGQNRMSNETLEVMFSFDDINYDQGRSRFLNWGILLSAATAGLATAQAINFANKLHALGKSLCYDIDSNNKDRCCKNPDDKNKEVCASLGVVE